MRSDCPVSAGEMISKTDSYLPGEGQMNAESFCPVTAGSDVTVKPQAQAEGCGKPRDSSLHSALAGDSCGQSTAKGQTVSEPLPMHGDSPKGESLNGGSQCVAGFSHSGALAGEVLNVADQFLDVFHVERLRLVPFQTICKEIDLLPKSCFQVGISLAQLLLAHPRDGKYIYSFLRSTWTKSSDTPTRRDLLPFMFCPSVGAAMKVVALFPESPNGVIRVDRSSVKKIPRQQAKKLVVEGNMQLWRWLMVQVLNGEYMDWTISSPISPGKPSLAQMGTLERMGEQVKYFAGDPLFDWELPNYPDLLGTKTIDYAGDEVSHALTLRLEELLPGLPEPSVGGSLIAVDVVDDVVKAWLVDPAKTLKPVERWPPKVPTAKINATKEEWYRVVKALYDRNILTTIEEQDIFRVQGEKVLNGAFAASKSGTPAAGETRITRFIMNMTPSNAYQVLMRGDLQTLSSSSNWASLVLPPGHCLLWSSDDQRGAFYAWRLPAAWRGLMTFRWPVPGRMLGLTADWVYVCSAVIPMGWLNAVSLFQHLHRRLGLSKPPIGSGFPEHKEWRRDRPVPQGSKDVCIDWIQYYLDDFDAPEVVPENDVEKLRGSVSAAQQTQRAAYAAQGVDISMKKAHNREPCVLRMGAEIDGIAGLLSAPRSKMREAIGFVLWLLSQHQPKVKGSLMVLGRLVRCFEFRRPLMSLLRNCWPKVTPTARRPLSAETVRALVRASIMLPMAVADLRLPVDGLVTSSDVSESGGGLCASTSLTDEGHRTLETLQSDEYVRTRLMGFSAAGAMAPSKPKGPKLFVLSLFDGVAAAMVALARLDCQVVGFAASEIDKECKRLVRKRWPGVIELGKVESIQEKTITDLLNGLGYEVDCLLIVAGSPCQDLTALLANRMGLHGSRSRLFYEIPRIHRLCKNRFPGMVALMVENVFSMTEDSRDEFTRILGVQPVLVLASDVSWVRRPRLYWISWELSPQGEERLLDKGGYLHWQLPDVRLEHGHWVDDGWKHLGKEALPTFTRSLPRTKPPLQPAGISTASATACSRWTQDRHQFQVYQYEDHHLLWQGSIWRLPSLQERERLMGFDVGYISNALPEKWSPKEQFRQGCGMIGNTFHVHSVALLFHALITVINPSTPPRDVHKLLCSPGVAPHGWTKTPTFSQNQKLDPGCCELVHEILRQGDKAGTDIRLDVGIPFRFKAFPRAGLRTSYFSWKIIHGYKWQHTSHINALELQAVVSSLQWRLRKLSNYRKRVLHLVDSQVVACVIAKGRTSSYRLRKGLQKLNSLLLASGVKLCVGYCHTSENPADIPSRWSETKTRKQRGR